MKFITERCLSYFVRDFRNTSDPEVRAAYGALEGWISVIINILLFLVKLIPGILTGSISLIADAFHSLSDAGSSIIVIAGFKISKKPSDDSHPFGHERAENITALIIAILVIVTGVEFFRVSVNKILHPTEIEVGWGLITLIATTIIAKEFLALFAKDLGKRIDSRALEGDFWHHRTDSISTGLVLIAIISAHFGYSGIDGIAGIGVSGIIIFAGFMIGKEAINPLLGEAPDPDFIQGVQSKVLAHEQVEGVHDIIVHSYGSFKLISLHIEISDAIPPLEAHELAEHIEDDIEKVLNAKAVIHVDPINRDYEHYGEIEKKLIKITETDNRILSFHDLRVVGKDDRINLVFDVVVTQGIKPEKYNQLKKHISTELKNTFPFIRATVITIETCYTGG